MRRVYSPKTGITYSPPVYNWLSSVSPLPEVTEEQAGAVAAALNRDPCPTVDDVRAYTRDAGLEFSDEAAHYLLHAHENTVGQGARSPKYVDFDRGIQRAELARHGVRFPHEYRAARRAAQEGGDS